MRKILLILNVLAFVASLVWLYEVQNFESLISSILTFGGLIGFKVTKSKKDKNKISMKQKAEKKSTQYQSGGDMTINN